MFIGWLNWGKQLDRFFKQSSYLKPNSKILDAGCGTGIVTKVLYQISKERNYENIQFYAFDLTENMLKIFRKWISAEEANNIEVAQANVLDINGLPSHWQEFDFIGSSTMLEYLPRSEVKEALANLKRLLKPGGLILVIVTKRNLLTSWFAGKWWKANLYKKAEIKQAFQDAGFKEMAFKKFTFGWSSAIIVIEAKK